MASLFQRSHLTEGVSLVQIGLVPERPFQILGLLETLAFGDFILNVVFLSTLANQFDHARLHVKYRDARPYAKDIISLSPWIDVAEPYNDSGAWFALTRKTNPFMAIGTQKGRNRPVYDMVVTSYMAQRELVNSLPHPVALSLPENRVDELRSRLRTLGISMDRWFAVFHYRESTYEYREKRGSHRDSDPKVFEQLADHIISLGGQVVRLGHAGMSPFRARPGFIDLAAEPALIQAAAASYSRFMIAGPSGACALAMAFQLPATIVDAVDTLGMWGPIDTLTHVVNTPDQRLRNQSLKASGLLHGASLAAKMKADPRIRVSKATVEDLCAVADRLFERTFDCTGWRSPKARSAPSRRNSIEWPLRPTDTMTWVDV